jgi:hypothetical protein
MYDAHRHELQFHSRGSLSVTESKKLLGALNKMVLNRKADMIQADIDIHHL